MQARRVEEKTESSLIKDNTTGDSKWMEKTMEIMEQYQLKRWHLKLKKEALKKIIKQRTRKKWEEEIESEKKEKTKIKHWNNLTTNTNTKRPEYMEKLTRKESQAMLRARTSMMNVRMNYKNGQEKHKCRFCNEAEETQEHVVQDCQKIKRINDTIRYAEIFKENNMEKTRAIARALIQINNTLDET